MPTPDNPDEFYLLLALVVALLPLQWYLGQKLHERSTATSFWQCFFAISNADIHKIRDEETDEFKATLKAYKRRYIYVMVPVFAVIFGVYLWLKSG